MPNRVGPVAVLLCGLLPALLFPATPAARLQARPSARTAWLDMAVRQAGPDDTVSAWVYFTDKGADVSGAPAITTRAARRRALRGSAATATRFADRPLEPTYVARVRVAVTRVRHEVRWLNAVSIEATPAQIDAVSTLGFVSRLDVVRKYRRERERVDPAPDGPVPARRASIDAETPLDYGTSLDQLRQMEIPDLHARGLRGDGVIIAVFDSGFPNLTHQAYTSLTVLGEHDFVAGRPSVRESTDSHGTNTLSTLAAFAPGELIGAAFKASYLLAVTEDVSSETPIEEDHWAAAVEWAEAQGADIISSSLGYGVFDRPHTSYQDRDMDGQTAVTSRAAALAAERGLVVVNSAGNGGLDTTDNTLVAPGDGVRVLTVGAVNRLGTRAGFSSVGPTADGRIKPDVAAMASASKLPATSPTATASPTARPFRARSPPAPWPCCCRRTPTTPSTRCCRSSATQPARRPPPTACSGGASSTPSPPSTRPHRCRSSRPTRADARHATGPIHVHWTNQRRRGVV